MTESKAPATAATTPAASPAVDAETMAAAANAKFVKIDLVDPIVRGETRIECLTVRKPKSGELRNLSLQDVIGTDISTLLRLLPRISDPVLTDEECNGLDPADLTEIGGAVRGFFMTRAELQMMEAMMADQQPKT